MIVSKLINYINQEVSKGSTLESIRINLETSGWSEADIEQAFSQANINQPIDSTNLVKISTVSLNENKKPEIVNQKKKNLIGFIIIALISLPLAFILWFFSLGVSIAALILNPGVGDLGAGAVAVGLGFFIQIIVPALIVLVVTLKMIRPKKFVFITVPFALVAAYLMLFPYGAIESAKHSNSFSEYKENEATALDEKPVLEKVYWEARGNKIFGKVQLTVAKAGENYGYYFYYNIGDHRDFFSNIKREENNIHEVVRTRFNEGINKLQIEFTTEELAQIVSEPEEKVSLCFTLGRLSERKISGTGIKNFTMEDYTTLYGVECHPLDGLVQHLKQNEDLWRINKCQDRCIDSDFDQKPNDLYVSGYTEDGDGKRYDKCNGDFILERFCQENCETLYIDYKCPKGCFNRACIK